MKRRRHSSSYSIDSVIKMLVLLLIAVIIGSTTVSLYVISLIRRQTVQGLLDTMSLYVSQVDMAHISINKYLLRSLKQEEVLRALETGDILEEIRSADQVKSEVDVFMESFQEEYQIFFYNEKNGRLLRPGQVYSWMTKEELERLNQALISHMRETESYRDAWDVLCTDSQVYFVKAFRSGDNYAGCCISADSIIKPLTGMNMGEDGFTVISSEEGVPLTSADEIERLGIRLSGEKGPGAYISRNKMVISGSLAMGAFHPHIILSQYFAYEKIIVIQSLIVGMMAVIAIILAGSVIYMRMRVLKPIKIFSENLSRISETEKDIDLKDTHLIELEKANVQFKNLMRQITKLKIDVYEKELEKQRTLMNYYQIQIRPHFFLNCLNTIYSMAQTQLCDEIMKMSVITSKYFRYIFQSGQDFVTIGRELNHIENYMEIQKLRYGDRFFYEIYAEEGTKELLILPVLIQTFIENAVRHASCPERKITIRTDVEWACAGEDPYGNVQIQITDTGDGFEKEILEKLNHSQELKPVDGHRIGITNALKRLAIFYGPGEAAVTFSNLPSGGACVTILLPARRKPEMGEQEHECIAD